MVNRSGKRRPLPPSRERYERSHPTVSLRVDLDLYAQLKALKEKANLSVADVLKVGLQKANPLSAKHFATGSCRLWRKFTRLSATAAKTRLWPSPSPKVRNQTHRSKGYANTLISTPRQNSYVSPRGPFRPLNSSPQDSIFAKMSGVHGLNSDVWR